MLSQIVANKREEIKTIHLDGIEQIALPQYSLYKQIQHDPEVSVIAEVKKASPSKGVIREDFHPVKIAEQYEQAGATAISVLTDEKFFQGKKSYLTHIKKSVSLPVLRKDFILDPLQVKESAKIGADAILLMATILEPTELHDLYDQAHELGLEVLVEVHTETELRNVLNEFTPVLLGINNRDLKTFTVDLETTNRLSKLVPDECLIVSESGIFTNQDLQQARERGADAVLVGESLMREDSPKHALQTLRGVGVRI